MRQAQRDLGISGESRTLLIDANRPEVGWGRPLWVDPSSFFRRAFGDVEIIPMTTQQAATTVFAQSQLMVDYLHIDADHSFSSCLTDFYAYRPFLRRGSFVTFHDTNFPAAGVRHVIDYLRKRRDLEIVDLKEWGAGTALVNIVADENDTHEKGDSYSQLPMPRIHALRKPITEQQSTNDRESVTLNSAALSSRNILAARLVRQCATVVEFSSAYPTVASFLDGPHTNVIVIGQHVEPKRVGSLRDMPCDVQQLCGRLQDIDWIVDDGANCGVVLLNLELSEMDDADYAILRELFKAATVVVIELAATAPRARQQFDIIRHLTRIPESFCWRINLPESEAHPIAPDREMHVFRCTDCPR
jgi:hypothetical protein